MPPAHIQRQYKRALALEERGKRAAEILYLQREVPRLLARLLTQSLEEPTPVALRKVRAVKRQLEGLLRPAVKLPSADKVSSV